MAWRSTQWNSGVKLDQMAGGFRVHIPEPGGHLNSIQRNQDPIGLKKTISFTCRVKATAGKPKFVSLDTAPAPPALKPNCRILLQRSNDDWTGSGGTEHYRWWSTGALCVFLTLDGVEKTYSVQVDPKNWTNVWGKPATQFKDKFKACLNDLDNIQLVFGGGNSFSHGIYVKNGKATFELLSFAVK